VKIRLGAHLSQLREKRQSGRREKIEKKRKKEEFQRRIRSSLEKLKRESRLELIA